MDETTFQEPTAEERKQLQNAIRQSLMQIQQLRERIGGHRAIARPHRSSVAQPDPARPHPFNTQKPRSPEGNSGASLTPEPGEGKSHPAIIWITGGDCNSIGDVWSPASPDNDQTAAAYRKAGIVM